jgi:hypothetical protein
VWHILITPVTDEICLGILWDDEESKAAEQVKVIIYVVLLAILIIILITTTIRSAITDPGFITGVCFTFEFLIRNRNGIWILIKSSKIEETK